MTTRIHRNPIGLLLIAVLSLALVSVDQTAAGSFDNDSSGNGGPRLVLDYRYDTLFSVSSNFKNRFVNARTEWSNETLVSIGYDV